MNMLRFRSSLERHTPERLFATELMEYVAKVHHLSHVPFETICRIGLVPDTPFRKNIREAVDRMSERLRPISLGMYVKLIGFVEATPHQFEAIARQLCFGMNIRGYNEKEFLECCVLVCLLAVMGRRNGILTAPNIATIVIDDTVQWFKMSGGWPVKAWDDLEKEAEFFEI